MDDEPVLYSRAYAAPRTSLAFLSSDPRIRLGGTGLRLARAEKWGIDDKVFRSQVARFRIEPQAQSGIVFEATPGDLALLPSPGDVSLHGGLPGAPTSASAIFGDLTTMELMRPYLPVYGLPTCDAVSVPDVMLVLKGFRAGNLAPLGRAPAGRTTRRLVEAARRKAGSGRVTPEHLVEFADVHWQLKRELYDAIPWERSEWRSSAPARAANAIASGMLGIPVDLRIGSLVPARWVTSATYRAAGRPNPAGDDRDVVRLRAFVTRLVPKVRVDEYRLGNLRGAAWSVALDEVLNHPAIWFRDAAGELPCAGGRGTAAPARPLATPTVLSEDQLRAFGQADPRDMALA